MKCAVCICTCDRADMLEHLLATLRGMDFGSLDPAQIELIIVDNHPDGQAWRLCRRLEPTLPVTVFSKRLFVRHLCGLSRESGTIYRSSGRSYQYY